MKTIHVIVEGLVQGVCFRDYTRRQAEQLHLTGWVRNKKNGSVEAMIRGTESDVASMLEWLWLGSPSSKVESVRHRDVTTEKDYATFEVRY